MISLIKYLTLKIFIINFQNNPFNFKINTKDLELFNTKSREEKKKQAFKCQQWHFDFKYNKRDKYPQ